MPFERLGRRPVQFLLPFAQFDGSILHSIALVYLCRAFFLLLPKGEGPIGVGPKVNGPEEDKNCHSGELDL